MGDRVFAFAPMFNGYIVINYTRGLAREVRRDFGRLYRQATPEDGWKMALKEGYRVVRVIVTIAPTQTEDHS